MQGALPSPRFTNLEGVGLPVVTTGPSFLDGTWWNMFPCHAFARLVMVLGIGRSERCFRDVGSKLMSLNRWLGCR